MGLFNFFKKRKKEVLIEDIQRPVEVDTTRRYIDYECEFCKKKIGYDHYSKLQGKYFHKNCYKNATSQVMAGGIVKK